MSYARDKRKKQLRQKKLAENIASGVLTEEDVKYANSIRRKIRKGELPRYHFVKDGDGNIPKNKIKRWVLKEGEKGKEPKLEPVLGGFKLLLVSTFNILTKK